MKKKEIVDIDIRFLFALFTSFIGMWIYLFNYIINLGTEDPSNLLLISYAILHYTIFLFLGSVIILVFYKGLSYTDSADDFLQDSKIMDIINNNKSFVLKWWPFFFFSALLTIIFTLLLSTIPVWVVLLSYIIAFLLYIPIIGSNRLLKKQTFKVNFKFLFCAFFLFFIYVPFMSIISSDVKITTEKEFYKTDDVLRLEVKRKGYMFLPEIDTILLNRCPLSENTKETLSFQMSEKCYHNNFSNYIIVKYSPQFFFKKEKYQTIKITKE